MSEDIAEIIKSVVAQAIIYQTPDLDRDVAGTIEALGIYGVFACDEVAANMPREMISEIISQDVGLVRIGDFDDVERTDSAWDRIIASPFTNDSLTKVLVDWNAIRPLKGLA
ncbi:MAG: hypothetical protein WBA67_03890 [Jannaschia sp.]